MPRRRLVWSFLALSGACIAACTLDFDRFEGAAASSTVAASSGGSGGTSSSASTTGPTGGGPSCDMQYGTAPSYLMCVDNQVCEFNADVNGTSCAVICSDRGGECLYTFQNQGDCGHGQRLECGFTDNQTVICVCSRGCGTGPPCSAPDTCTAGTCG